MTARHPHITHLIKCIELEEKEQSTRYNFDASHTLKALKAEGLVIHPIVVTHKNFGYADYPEITFKLNYPTDTGLFKDGAALECFFGSEAPIKGIAINITGKGGEFRLFAPDYPDWIDERGVGIKLAPDTHTTTLMKKGLHSITENAILNTLFSKIYNNCEAVEIEVAQNLLPLNFNNKNLNNSQKTAINAVLNNQPFTIIHGPPGTGKTTTLIEAIYQITLKGQKVLVAAPSNTAVDNIASGLIAKQINILRIGNSTKVNQAIFKHTIEGKINNTNQQKEIKQLKIRAEQFRKLALKYKKKYGKAEQEQRNLLFKEVKNIRTEIKKIQAYNEDKLYTEAQVILGTPIGLYDAPLKKINFNTLLIDEAGQCLQPLAWCIFGLAHNIVLAGDHLQLPPTVLSNQAANLGLNKSILEVCIKNIHNVFLLNTQYRMRQVIAGFSSHYFYNNKLLTAQHLLNNAGQIIFIDTAGSGFNETRGNDGVSLQNQGELKLAKHIITVENLTLASTAFISPYAGQVAAAQASINNLKRISTIDSFQGQEEHTVIISLVRSNNHNIIGFLKDYRRINVAITRAKDNLYIIGDSATLGNNKFYNTLLTYIQKNGTYKTVWDYDLVQ